MFYTTLLYQSYIFVIYIISGSLSATGFIILF